MSSKLLLRVYGPQAEHLIDREKELEILKRLSQKRIGPCLLGTFDNGRFEQYLNANPLSPRDLRSPEVSKQIAKRMRELHDGVDLTPEERSAGPRVWQNWDKWVKRCETIITWLDERILKQGKLESVKTGALRSRGLICGVQWEMFRNAVDSYRKWLEEQYNGQRSLRDHLVFAHNDVRSLKPIHTFLVLKFMQTQYGNILRVESSSESPLLLPSNEHKQLVVIDFEYANANTPGFEFANHFSEWCYDYHSPTASWACSASAYPHPEEQRRFIKAYAQHKPNLVEASPSLRPEGSASSGSGPHRNSSQFSLGPSALDAPSPLTTLAAMKLEARVPPTTSYDEEEKAREDAMEKQVDRLMADARLWRVACSAQWVAWGIVQATVTGTEEALEAKSGAVARDTEQEKAGQEKEKENVPPTKQADFLSAGSANKLNDAATTEEVQKAELRLEQTRPPHDHNIEHEEKQPGDDEEEEEGFDYLAYAQDRALLFWGDLLEMGLVSETDLPADVVKRAKRIPY